MAKTTLAWSVVEKFLTPEQQVKFRADYEAHKGRGLRSRFDLVKNPFTQEEKDIIIMFLDETKTTDDVKVLTKSNSKQQAIDKVNSICRKIVYQNRDSLLK